MNDPMEAFYETGGIVDTVGMKILGLPKPELDKLYDKLRTMLERFGLVCFSSSQYDLPMWAYYGSNFGGMCLEFEGSEIVTGDFQNEPLRPVTYSKNALPPLTLADIAGNFLEEAMIARITRKREEWSHERERRFVVGQLGPKYYLDDAICRVYLGPRVLPSHAEKVCEVLDRRPVEILQGEIKGFDLSFRVIKKATPLKECVRVGAGIFDLSNAFYDEPQLKQFLSVPFEKLLNECERTALRPNMEEFAGIDISSNKKDCIYFHTTFRLRSGREVYQRRYFDRQLNLLEDIN